MQGKRQCRCVVWIINWALQVHCKPRVPLGAIKLFSEDWTKRDHRGLQRIYGILYSFFILGKRFLDVLKLGSFLSFYPVAPKMKIICFWFGTIKNDWSWRKSYITVLGVLVDIIGVLFYQLVSLFEKLDSNFQSFFTE